MTVGSPGWELAGSMPSRAGAADADSSVAATFIATDKTSLDLSPKARTPRPEASPWAAAVLITSGWRSRRQALGIQLSPDPQQWWTRNVIRSLECRW